MLGISEFPDIFGRFLDLVVETVDIVDELAEEEVFGGGSYLFKERLDSVESIFNG